MDPRITITGGIQESGILEVRTTFAYPEADLDRPQAPDLKPTETVVEQGSSGIAPGLSLPLAR